jgi:hypothetical protein
MNNKNNTAAATTTHHNGKNMITRPTNNKNVMYEMLNALLDTSTPHQSTNKNTGSSSSNQQRSSSDSKKRKSVKTVCTNCRQAHAKCDNELPCGRCIRLNLSKSCVPAPNQKRGRKKIRTSTEEEDELRYGSNNHVNSDSNSNDSDNNQQESKSPINGLSFNDLLGEIMLDINANEIPQHEQQIHQQQLAAQSQISIQDITPSIIPASDEGLKTSSSEMQETIEYLRRENELLKMKLQDNVVIVNDTTTQSEQGILVTVRRGHIANWNSCLMKKLGYGETDQLPDHWVDFVHPLYHEICHKKLNEMNMQRQTSMTVENVLLKKKDVEQCLVAKKVIIQFAYDQNTCLPLFAVSRFYF